MKLAWIASSLLAVVGIASSSSAQVTERVDADSFGHQDEGDNMEASIAGDGRYVAFTSGAADLVRMDSPSTVDVFVHDRLLGDTRRITNVTNSQTDSCSSPSISADGRLIAYAYHHLGPFAAIGSWIYVYDSETGTTINALGSGSLNGYQTCVLSGDGRSLAYTQAPAGPTQIAVVDLTSGTVSVESVSSYGTPGNGSSLQPALSFDGRFLTFVSVSSNLVPGDTNNKEDIFVRDLVSRTTERVSVDSNGVQADGNSRYSAVSADGRFVVFDSLATNLVTGDTNGANDVFLRDRAIGATTRVSVDASGNQGDGDSQTPVISSDGRFIAFASNATDLVGGDTNGVFDVFVLDRVTGALSRSSVDSSGAQSDGHSFVPAITSDGARILFLSQATNLVPGDTNVQADFFVRDLAPGCPLAATYCAAVANSTGQAASIGSTGWASLSANNLVLQCSRLPSSTHGLFFFGTTPIDPGVPFGNGMRCVGGPLVRLSVVQAQNGVVSQAQDLTTNPYAGVQPGSTRHFEFWYRDPAAGGANFNGSNALTLTFVN